MFMKITLSHQEKCQVFQGVGRINVQLITVLTFAEGFVVYYAWLHMHYLMQH